MDSKAKYKVMAHPTGREACTNVIIIPGNLTVQQALIEIVNECSNPGRPSDKTSYQLELSSFTARPAWDAFDNGFCAGWKENINDQVKLVLKGGDVTFANLGLTTADHAHISCQQNPAKGWDFTIDKVITGVSGSTDGMSIEEEADVEVEVEAEGVVPIRDAPSLSLLPTSAQSIPSSTSSLSLSTLSELNESSPPLFAPGNQSEGQEEGQDIISPIVPGGSMYASPLSKRKRPAHTVDGIYICGGMSDGGLVLDDVMRVTPGVDRAWHKLSSMPLQGLAASTPPYLTQAGFQAHSIATRVDQQGTLFLYVVGGKESFTIDRYDVRNNAWERDVVPIPITFDWYGVEVESVIIGDNLYIIGPNWTPYSLARYTQSSVATVDTSRVGKLSLFCFNFLNQEWMELADVPTRRFAPQVVVANDCIYVIGGGDTGKNTIWETSFAEVEPQSLATTERFDPLTGEWTTLASMERGRTNFGAAYLDGRIYVSGGEHSERNYLYGRMSGSYSSSDPDRNPFEDEDDDFEDDFSKSSRPVIRELLDTCEVYNIAQNQWEPMSDLVGGPRVGHKMIAFKGLVYAVGGVGVDGDETSFHRYSECLQTFSDAVKEAHGDIRGDEAHPGEPDDNLADGGARECGRWQNIMPLRRIRAAFGAIVVDGTSIVTKRTHLEGESSSIQYADDVPS